MAKPDAGPTFGIIHDRQGRYEDAHERHRQAPHVYREAGSRIGETIVLNNIGLLQGRYDEARRHHHHAVELSRRLDFPGDEAESFNALAEAARSMGDLAKAVAEHGLAPTANAPGQPVASPPIRRHERHRPAPRPGVPEPGGCPSGQPGAPRTR
ncbi:tetratricopeptide repeat protein [Streptomyces sp. NBC_00190]|uniref:tetratricopeptide repeat protein n=1 Tax=unclassified Streptomyces TaxID=2593676 RepID=UPI002E290600|nr:tetratricopeptide repeat protein [Streptomyces sp. NBC_00190]WSZ39118.1 tetratricopeptide repeat protein [Streptomyces sp. NBC_00868]